MGAARIANTEGFTGSTDVARRIDRDQTRCQVHACGFIKVHVEHQVTKRRSLGRRVG
jgi:hypothetical protein